MSRLGKLPVAVPEGVNVAQSAGVILVNGPRGKLEVKIPAGAMVELNAGQLTVKAGESRIQGVARSIVANAVKGVKDGWIKVLELNGTGFRANVSGTNLQLALGFSHPVTLAAPEGIAFEVKDNKISVSGVDKAVVGQIAANIRGLKPADPYKTKGFKYEDEIIIKKPGKAAKAGGVAGGAK